MEKIISEYTSMDIGIRSKSYEIMFNDFSDSLVNDICLIVKQYVYRQRCLHKPVSCHEVKYLIWKQESVEKYIAQKNHKLDKHVKKWRK